MHAHGAPEDRAQVLDDGQTEARPARGRRGKCRARSTLPAAVSAYRAARKAGGPFWIMAQGIVTDILVKGKPTKPLYCRQSRRAIR